MRRPAPTPSVESAAASPRVRPCTRIYLLLIALTVLTWAIGTAGLSGLTLSLLVLGLALIKGQLIGDFFMGLKRVSGPWRWVILIWLVVPGGLISTAFILAHGG